MATAGDEDNDAVLSDVEGDDPVPIVLQNPSQEIVSMERFREIVAELERERQAKVAVETSKSELQTSFNRLKTLAHEAIKKRDECARQRDEALREKDEALRSVDKISEELTETLRLKDEALKQRDETARQLDESAKSRDSSRSEIESAAQLIVTGIEKISGKVSKVKNFSGSGLPRSQKYSGLPAIAYGIIKRTNEIVEELLRQLETATKARNDARDQMEQRNYEIAIEVSQLEASINGLREDVSNKTSATENLEKSIADKDNKIAEMHREMSEKINLAEKEVEGLRQLVNELNHNLRNLGLKMDSQRPILTDQLNYVSKIHDQIYDIIKMVDSNKFDQSDLSESLFIPQETDMDENLRASLAGLESIYKLVNMIADRMKDVMEERRREAIGLNDTVAGLVKEKQHIGSLLRSALSRRMALDPSYKTDEVLQVAENGLKDAGMGSRISNLLGNDKNLASHKKSDALDTDDDEVYTLAGTLENIIKESQLEIIELKHSVEELRAESSLLKAHLEAQAKELSQRKQRIEELEEKERSANENVEGLMMDITAAEEEIARWKIAAEQEAAAGRDVEQNFIGQLSALRQELEEAKQAMLEAEKKLKFKEDTADAAMAARDAAEKSLRLADLRASRLRERVEELTRQLEEYDSREDSRSQNMQRYACWPWQWLGLNLVGSHQAETQQNSNEMELSEPLL